jgi:hypothetical protein
MSSISQDKAYIFRITHIENLPWLLTNGIHCRNSPAHDPNFREIGNPELIQKRAHRVVPLNPEGTLSDYVPFYFTPSSPMLYNIKTGYRGMRRTPMREIVILVSSLHRIAELRLPFVFTDRHAYLQTAQFRSELADLDIVDWKLLAARDFQRDPNDPGKLERYQAEALIHQHVPVSALRGVACFDSDSERQIIGQLSQAGVSLRVATKSDWYF